MTARIINAGTGDGGVKCATYGANLDEASPKCASYQRFSCDVQKETSIGDQERNCYDAAKQKNWHFLQDFARNDKGISGAALVTRDGLNSLIAEAKKRPRPFDCVLIDDTSRLGRNLSDVLRVSDIFRYNNVFLYFVTQRLDSRDAQYRKLLILHGMQVEDFLVGLRDRIHRGMKGAVLKGHHTGGTRYGYRRILIEHPTRKDEHGRPDIDYTILEVDPEQSKVVILIFEMTAQGKSLIAITKHLNGLGIPGPTGRDWAYTTIRKIVHDDLYIGIVKWNRTTNERDPESGKVRQRIRPESEWVVMEQPDLRIIPQELWELVQERNRLMQRIGRQRLGGFNKTKQSEGYLFSGLLACGLCAGAMGIIKSGRVPATYGCRKHRFEGRCSNAVTIRRDTLEEQLLGAMADKLRPEILDEAVVRLRAQIERHLDKTVDRETAADVPSLEARLSELKYQSNNLARAIARHNDSEALISELAIVESKIRDVHRQISNSRNVGTTTRRDISFQEFRDFVMQKAGNLEAALRGDPAVARETLRKIIRRLTLTPVQSLTGPMLEVTGDTDLFAVDSGVMLNSPVDRMNKQYTSLLSLTGLRLDPRKEAQAPEIDSSLPISMPIEPPPGSEGLPAA